MAVGMMNGPVSGPKQAAVSLPWVLIAKVASHCSGFKRQREAQALLLATVIHSHAALFTEPSVFHTALPILFKNTAEITALKEKLI